MIIAELPKNICPSLLSRSFQVLIEILASNVPDDFHNSTEGYVAGIGYSHVVKGTRFHGRLRIVHFCHRARRITRRCDMIRILRNIFFRSDTVKNKTKRMVSINQLAAISILPNLAFICKIPTANNDENIPY